jgi:hypothetical protein
MKRVLKEVQEDESVRPSLLCSLVLYSQKCHVQSEVACRIHLGEMPRIDQVGKHVLGSHKAALKLAATRRANGEDPRVPPTAHDFVFKEFFESFSAVSPLELENKT